MQNKATAQRNEITRVSKVNKEKDAQIKQLNDAITKQKVQISEIASVNI